MNSIAVHIWTREGKYLARGSFEAKRFGATLGADEQRAEVNLRRLLNELEDGTFLRPSDPAAKRRGQKKSIPCLTIGQLVEEFVEDKVKTLGVKTAQTYQSRLAHLVAFASMPETHRRYPLAQDIDRDFANEFARLLQHKTVSANGHPNGSRQPMKPSGRRNVLETARDLLNWASKPTTRRLPPDFVQPFTREIVGRKPRKNPLRQVDFGLERRIRMVRMADPYQLVHVVPRFVLPSRPEEICGLLISEIDFQQQTLWFGTRFDEGDWTKCRTSFHLPYPPQLQPLLLATVGNRGEGPVFRKRAVFERRAEPRISVNRPGDLEREVGEAVRNAPRDEPVGPNDSKPICRRIIQDAGGVAPKELAEEFARMKMYAGVDTDAPFYNLRHAITTEYDRLGIPQNIKKYVTDHPLTDILDEYTSLDLEQVTRHLQEHWAFAAELLETIAERADQLHVGQDADDRDII